MVNIHNIMEEQVECRVNQLYDQVDAQKVSWLNCACENCRQDTICYVLNRIPPHYVLGGRGVTHASAMLQDNQLLADMDRLAYEGMKIVNSVQRPYHAASASNGGLGASTPQFIFPTFTGSVFGGTSFAPIADASVTLKENGVSSRMRDASWPNPCRTYDATRGCYSFWVAPKESEALGESRVFSFTVEVSAEGYAPVTYSFEIPLKSEINSNRALDSTRSLKLKDLFLFRADGANEAE